MRPLRPYRHRLPLLAAALLSAVLCRPDPAQAQAPNTSPFFDDDTPPAPPPASPQHYAVEIKFGPYVPHIDSSAGLNGKTPFSDLFGSTSDPVGAVPSRVLLSQVEIDYQPFNRWPFFNQFGSLGFGLSGGFLQMSAPQPIFFGAEPGPLTTCLQTGAVGQTRNYAPPPGATLLSPAPGGCFSGDQNYLNLVPLELLAVFRFDYFDKRFRIPIIPYMKAGFGYYIWWNGTSGEFVTHLDEVPTSNGSWHDTPPGQARLTAAGASSGIVLHPGIAIDLGAIDRDASRTMDREIGLNKVGFFCELNYAWVNGFGAANKLNLSDTTFNAGVLLEF